MEQTWAYLVLIRTANKKGTFKDRGQRGSIPSNEKTDVKH